MKLKSTLSLLCVTGLMAMALAGCGSNSAGTASAASAASNSENVSSSSEPSSSEIIGQVQSVSDKTVTLLLGDLTDAGQNQNGAPAVGGGSSSASLNTSPDALQAPTDGQSSSQQPGGQPGGQPDENQPVDSQPARREVFMAGTETADITITDDTAINVETVSGETEGSIDDIKEGTVLDVTMDDNNMATAIIVKNVMTSNSEAPVPAGINTPAGSSSASQSTNG